jgi:hypothetical protein
MIKSLKKTFFKSQKTSLFFIVNSPLAKTLLNSARRPPSPPEPEPKKKLLIRLTNKTRIIRYTPLYTLFFIKNIKF